MKLSDRLARQGKDPQDEDDSPDAPAQPRVVQPRAVQSPPRAGANNRAAVRSAGAASRTSTRAKAAEKAETVAGIPVALTPKRAAPASAKVAGPGAKKPNGRLSAKSSEKMLTGIDELRKTVRAAVVAELGPTLATGAVDEAQIRALLEQQLDAASSSSKISIGPTERTHFLESTLADMLGWGALTILMEDPEVTEIMVNGLDSVWVEKAGRITRSRVRFPSMTAYRMVIDRMLAVAGRRVDEASPMADGRLPDGSRVNAVIPPLVVGEPLLTVRRFPEIAFTTADLVEKGSLSEEAAQFLSLAIAGKLNMLVSGGTGTGKTTLLNVLSGFIPDDERIITIEDAAELRLGQSHVVTLEARPANIEGAGLVSIRDLVRNALRMRPDRIVVGEVRDAAALDMLQAMNTGHEGSMTTVHANTPRDALSRIETMVLMAGIELPLRAIREQVASAIDIVVQLERQQDGKRVISKVTEVQGREGDVITLQDVYARKGSGDLEATGLRPHSADKLLSRGFDVPALLFRSGTPPLTALPARKAAQR